MSQLLCPKPFKGFVSLRVEAKGLPVAFEVLPPVASFFLSSLSGSLPTGHLAVRCSSHWPGKHPPLAFALADLCLEYLLPQVSMWCSLPSPPADLHFSEASLITLL